MKKFLVTLLVLVILGGLGYGGYWYWNKSKTAEAPATGDEATFLLYESDYGFALELPTTWNGYKAKDNGIINGEFGEYSSVDFGFEAQDSIFNIVMMKKDAWAKMELEEGPKPTRLGENDEYMFGYAGSQDVVNDEMAARRAEVDSIVSTFRLK